ncbi:MAG TPA: hypothetical protein VFX01_03260, partial [Methylophilaceae bacterium]|nr:hypothetical protein [Methylophilaceae bacterium]
INQRRQVQDAYIIIATHAVAPKNRDLQRGILPRIHPSPAMRRLPARPTSKLMHQGGQLAFFIAFGHAFD